MTAAIVANGEFPRKEYPRWLLQNADAATGPTGISSGWELNRPRWWGIWIRWGRSRVMCLW